MHKIFCFKRKYIYAYRIRGYNMYTLTFSSISRKAHVSQSSPQLLFLLLFHETIQKQREK